MAMELSSPLVQWYRTLQPDCSQANILLPFRISMGLNVTRHFVHCMFDLPCVAVVGVIAPRMWPRG